MPRRSRNNRVSIVSKTRQNPAAEKSSAQSGAAEPRFIIDRIRVAT
jgi:hypothetical protein